MQYDLPRFHFDRQRVQSSRSAIAGQTTLDGSRPVESMESTKSWRAYEGQADPAGSKFPIWTVTFPHFDHISAPDWVRLPSMSVVAIPNQKRTITLLTPGGSVRQHPRPHRLLMEKSMAAVAALLLSAFLCFTALTVSAGSLFVV
jgi:hypothetical protein